MRRAAKRDDNEPLIVRALESAGWTVVRVSDTGVPDLLCAKDGTVTLLEVKAVDGTLTKAQRETFTRLATAGVLVQVVRSPQEALGVLDCSWDGVVVGGVAKRRWLAVSGAFICESCWLPEDGLHDKKCPHRTKLKPKPAVQSAHRAAKKVEDAMPKEEGVLVVTEDDIRKWIGVPRPSRGVEGELQPLKVRKPPKTERCRCGHSANLHSEDGRYCFGEECPCIQFVEKLPPSAKGA